MRIEQDLRHWLDDVDLNAFPAGKGCRVQVRLEADFVSMRNDRPRQSIRVFSHVWSFRWGIEAKMVCETAVMRTMHNLLTTLNE